MTPKQQMFIKALFGEAQGNYRTAMDMAEYSKNTSISDVLKGCEEDIITASKNYLAANAPKAAMAIVVRATCNHVYSLCLVACRNATGVVVSVAHYAFEICRENSVTTHLQLLFHSIAPAVRQRKGSSARSR